MAMQRTMLRYLVDITLAHAVPTGYHGMPTPPGSPFVSCPYLGAWYGMAWGGTLILRYVQEKLSLISMHKFDETFHVQLNYNN